MRCHLRSEKLGLRLLLILLAVKAVLSIAFILSGLLNLGPDEAQYWTWSQKLALGYYSKPPGIAWQIAIGTYVFGDTEMGVRALAIVIGTLIPIATYSLARCCHLCKETACIAALALAFSPFGILASLLAITDGGLVLFWTIAMAFICRALSSGTPMPFYAIGISIMFGALFKWPAYTLWLVVGVIAWRRKELFSIHAVIGVLISFLGMLPTLIWNMENGWPTFKHVSSTVYAQSVPLIEMNGNPGIFEHLLTLFKGNFFEFIGMQALLVFPLSFVLLAIIFYSLGKSLFTLKNASLSFCISTLIVFIVPYMIAALFKKIQGNWVDFILPMAFVVLAWGCYELRPRLKPWLNASVMLSAMVMLSLPYLALYSKQNRGNRQLHDALIAAGYNAESHFLFGDKYQSSSLLSFYAPGQKRAYFLNLHGIRNNQFSFWPSMADEQIGRSGFFASIQDGKHLESDLKTLPQSYTEALTPYFADVEYVGFYPLQYSPSGTLMKGCLLFKGKNYNGLTPKESLLY